MGQLVFQATLGGQVNLVGPNTASTFNINVPAVAGNMVTTGDTGTVTNTMLASSAYTAPGTIGSGTANTGAFTTLVASSTVTLSGGTANGVAYLNGSKVLTTGSALTFDGTTLGSTGGVRATGPAASFAVDGVTLDYTASITRLAAGRAGGNYGQFDLYVAGASGITKRFSAGYDSTFQWFGSDGTSEQMRLTSTGLGVGTTSPNGRLDIVGGYARFVENASGAEVYLRGYYGGASVAAIQVVSNSPLAFVTNNQERARIDSSGNLLVGDTSQILSGNLGVLAKASSNAAAFKSNASTTFAILNIWGNETSGNQIFNRFATDVNQERGSITYNRGAGLVAYNVTSDYRAKDIIGPVADSGTLIDSVPVYIGKMKGATQERPMFIAHEVPAYAHTGEKDAVDADGNPVYQQMDTSALVPVMWAEIQSLRQRLAAAGI